MKDVKYHIAFQDDNDTRYADSFPWLSRKLCQEAYSLLNKKKLGCFYFPLKAGKEDILVKDDTENLFGWPQESQNN